MYRSRAVRRRRAATFLVLTALALGAGVVLARRVDGSPGLSPLRARIVAVAEGQVGYRTDPSDTYCNKFSAYWNAGIDDCGNDNLDEEWCADFAAWVWKQAGAEVHYQLAPGYLNGNSASFYVWGTDHGTWHPVGSCYAPQPGDVAVYGLDTVGGHRRARGRRHRCRRPAATPHPTSSTVTATEPATASSRSDDHQADADVKGNGRAALGLRLALDPAVDGATDLIDRPDRPDRAVDTGSEAASSACWAAMARTTASNTLAASCSMWVRASIRQPAPRKAIGQDDQERRAVVVAELAGDGRGDERCRRRRRRRPRPG